MQFRTRLLADGLEPTSASETVGKSGAPRLRAITLAQKGFVSTIKRSEGASDVVAFSLELGKAVSADSGDKEAMPCSRWNYIGNLERE